MMKMIKANIMVLLMLTMSACAVSYPRPEFSEILSIETSPATNVRIMDTSAVQSGDQLVINGKVKRVSRYLKKWIPLGHIDAVLVDKDGLILYETTADYLPRIIPRKTIARKSSFSLTMPVVAPVGSILRLSFHPNSHL